MSENEVGSNLFMKKSPVYDFWFFLNRIITL